MQLLRNISLLFIVIFVLSCNTNRINSKSKNVLKSEFAKDFEISNYKTYSKITVFSDGANNTYFLLPKGNKIPDSLRNENIIKIPVKKVVCLSTTYLGFIENLDERNSVCGVSTANLIYDSLLQKNVKSGKIREIGSFPNINIETIIALKPDIVFAYNLDGQTINQYEQLEKFGIKVVFVNEYLEETPLGRAEWLKFFAAFYAKNKLADEHFDKIKSQYLQLKNNIPKNAKKPGVLVNIPFQGIWYLPGGDSYFANLINDAGGNYLWKNKKQSNSFIVSLEDILLKNDSIDILLNPGTVNSFSEILNTEKRINSMNFIKNRNVYNNNKRLNINGGNDFWESGVVNPNIVLKDLIQIFYNLKHAKLYYYKKID